MNKLASLYGRCPLVILLLFALLHAPAALPTQSKDFESKIYNLLLEIDFSGDVGVDSRSSKAIEELSQAPRETVIEAMHAILAKQGTDITEGQAQRLSITKASAARQLMNWNCITDSTLDLLRGNLKHIAKGLLTRTDSGPINFSPAEIDSILRPLVTLGTPDDIRLIKETGTRLSRHTAQLSQIWSQSIFSDLEMLQKEKSQDTSAKPAKTTASTPPTISSPPTKAKSSEATKLPTPREDPPSSTPWSIIVILIVAACGLLRLLLKRRS